MNKITKILMIFIIFFNLLYISSFINYTYAAGGKSVELDITSDEFRNQFNPANVGGESISDKPIEVLIEVINRVLVIIQVLGVIILVLSIAIAGINGILSADEGFGEDLGINLGTNINEYGARLDGVKQLNKSALSKIIRRGIIGSTVLFFSATIVKVVFRIIFYM